ncbi:MULTISPECIES: DNA cytosine methyltransferase [unclassified Crossiella]|uniref:DNA cytosine methyltransferase n=1 Tax=unclassified Crossiella TaxID=2620835 RepID=UPI001FFE94D9|nr:MULTISPECIES: DNA cytosine methyltransferase [unclassified Crossiella]MCK2236586.1 DNA cytosine methyltransferase [Crossiella sp. S99.2]MCK2250253.1 DNA cytosine methyltransferase [Crossiella sp. S99.1]
MAKDEVHEVIEICAGAGGQALGLEKAGFKHRLAIELDPNACATLRANRPDWDVRQGDVADPENWIPKEQTGTHHGVSLLAGGVPCPPFTIAGKQLGASDERDLFAWAVEKAKELQPKAVMLENVRGLSLPRFAGYRQHVLEELENAGYIAHWELLHASDYGVPQLRPRFVLVALQKEYAPYWQWPEKSSGIVTVGETLRILMGSNGWDEDKLETWVANASKIAPTIVGGSKKHGGADLGPTRAKRAWAEMHVDAMGVADSPPARGTDPKPGPKLTTEMVARLQGWLGKYDQWTFTGKKTSRYRQIGNAFPPPVAHALGNSIMSALKKEGTERIILLPQHDPISKVLRKSKKPLTAEQLMLQAGVSLTVGEFERRITLLAKDFDMKIETSKSGKVTYELGDFQAFLGQDEHIRNEKFQKSRTIS